MKTAEERTWMLEQERRADGLWKCGLRAFPDYEKRTPTEVFATCLTEADAEKYMKLRGDVIPHRLTQEVGWWEKPGIVVEKEMGYFMKRARGER